MSPTEGKTGRYWADVVLCAFWLAAVVWSAVSANASGSRPVLPAVLSAALALYVASVAAHRHNAAAARPVGMLMGPGRLRPGFRRAGVVMVSGCISLAAQVVIRLLWSSSGHFGGRPADLDFGPKCNATALIIDPADYPNRSLVEEWNSVWHTLWGVSILMLFPVTDAVLCGHRLGPTLLDIGSTLVFCYPVYNAYKRGKKYDNNSVFVHNSFGSNALEWAVGLLLGGGLGVLATALRPSKPRPWHRWVDRWQLVIGGGMFGVSLFFGIKSIATWNDSCGGGSLDVSSDPTLPFAAILLMGCPVVAAAVACWSWRRKPAEAQRHAQPAPSPSPSPSPSAPTASGVAGVGRTSAEPVGKATHGGLAGEILQVSHV